MTLFSVRMNKSTNAVEEGDVWVLQSSVTHTSVAWLLEENHQKNWDDLQKISHPYSCPHSTASTPMSLYLFLKDKECMQPGGQEGPQ